MRRLCVTATILISVLAASASAQTLGFVVGRASDVSGPVAVLRVVNTATGRVTAEYAIGSTEDNPSVAASPDGRTAFVATGTRLLRLTVFTGAMTTTTFADPLGPLVVSPDGTRVYVIKRSAATIHVVDAATGAAIGPSIALPFVAARMAVSSAGDRLYVLAPRSNAEGTVAVVDTAARSVVTTFTTDPSAVHLRVHPDGTRLFVAHSTYATATGNGDSLVAYESTSGVVQGRVALPDNRTSSSYFPGPVIVYSPSVAGPLALPAQGGRLYIPRTSYSAQKGGTYSRREVVDIVETAALSLVTTLPLPSNSFNSPGGIAAFDVAGSAHVWVASAGGLWEIDGSTNAVRTAGPGTSQFREAAFSPAPPCWFEVGAAALSFRSDGGSRSVTVPAPSSECTWTATPSADWISASPSSGSNAGTITVAVGPSTTPRSGSLTIAGQPIPVDQRILHVYVDSPLPGRSLTGPFALVGWAIDQNARTTAAFSSGIAEVRITDETPGFAVRELATTSTTYDRPDVDAAFGARYGNPGFRVMMPPLPEGRRVIVVRVRSEHDGVWHSTFIELIGAGTNVVSAVDAPPAPEPSHAGFRMSGWAVDLNAPTRCGISTVHIWAVPHDGGQARFLGAAGVGWSRPDLAAYLGVPGDVPCGWVLNMAPLPAGGYRFVAYAFAQATGAVASEAGVDGTIRLKPFGVVDSPVPGTQVSGAIGITGWALDDKGVERVAVFYNSTGQFIADATFVEGARPDVAAAYPNYPNRTRGGWGVSILTNMLPNGGNGDLIFRILAYDADGHVTLLATLHVQGVNQSSPLPFGTIDLPAQGATVSGIVPIFGWALTPAPKIIPADGSTIEVIIDNVVVGSPTFGQCRGTNGTNYPAAGTCNDDIATTFGMGYRNLAETSGAIGSFLLDTTTLTNGIHSLVWRVTDSAGALQGIGSRYFYVNNPAVPTEPPIEHDDETRRDALPQPPYRTVMRSVRASSKRAVRRAQA